jgi:hypothetical protein
MSYVKSFQFSNYKGYFSGELFGNNKDPGTESDYFCCDCKHKECNPDNFSKIIKQEPDSDIKYNFNNFSYRCDNFKENIGVDNFYFSGCSNTLGVGLPYESTWAYQLNKKLNGKDYVNLGINGGSASQIVYDAYHFIEKFGKPKAIFLLFPNLERHPFFHQRPDGAEFVNVHWDNGLEGKLSSVLKSVYPYDSSVFAFYNLIYSFELYCKELEIPLFWTCWDGALRRVIFQYGLSVKNYVNLETYAHLAIKDDIPDEFSKKYVDSARDLVHFGTRFQYWVYYSFLQKYLSETGNTLENDFVVSEEDLKKVWAFKKTLKKKGGIY